MYKFQVWIWYLKFFFFFLLYRPLFFGLFPLFGRDYIFYRLAFSFCLKVITTYCPANNEPIARVRQVSFFVLLIQTAHLCQ